MSPERNERRSFRTDLGPSSAVEDPESLFGQLNGRAAHVQHLWIHQGDLLRSYKRNYEESTDLAFELPTGTGKTLVGLLIGEYRRRRNDERIVYLCPTRQLVHQAAKHAAEYRIPASAVLPPDYDGFNAYQLGEAIAVTTYAALFNVNPRFDSPQVIILDDAHSAEQYIASPWTMQIDRARHERAFAETLALLRDVLPVTLRAESSSADQHGADSLHLVPTPHLAEQAGSLATLLDDALEEGSDPWFAWRQLRGHLDSCGLYVSSRTIEIRPYIPPALTHVPFARANQRLYMSATLGAAGELERITGVRRIERLPLPESGERRISQGRRLFLFPELSLDDDGASSATINALSAAERALVLTPTSRVAGMIADHLEDRGLRVFRAPDVEQSLDPFVEGQGVLVLANRYDGLDLPGDACRLLVFEDMPIGTSRLEQFLVYRVGASDLMRDRIRTRFAQGIGRCTRNSNDYACVIARGQRLIDFCLRTEVRESLSPELQAEMRFGIQNSREIDEQGLTDLIELFFEQDEDWQQAVRAIESLKESTSQREDLVSERLQEVVEWEVDFVYALWAQDCETAVTKAVQVADRLGGQETAAYRAWWYYQAGSASWLYGLHDNDDQRINQARAFFRRATEARFTTWLAPLTRADAQLEASRETPVQDIHAAEGAIEFIDGLGYSGPRFERFTDRMQEFLEQSSSDAFEAGLKRLGQLLGMRAIRPDDVADPDAVWICHAKNVFVLEAKSEEEPRHAVSVATVRQARTHPDWVRANCEIPDDVEFLNVVISPRTTIEPEAARSSEGLYHATLDDIREVASQAVSALSVIRANAASVQRDAAVTTAMEHLHAFRLTPTQLWSRLKERPLDSLPKPGD